MANESHYRYGRTIDMPAKRTSDSRSFPRVIVLELDRSPGARHEPANLEFIYAIRSRGKGYSNEEYFGLFERWVSLEQPLPYDNGPEAPKIVCSAGGGCRCCCYYEANNAGDIAGSWSVPLRSLIIYGFIDTSSTLVAYSPSPLSAFAYELCTAVILSSCINHRRCWTDGLRFLCSRDVTLQPMKNRMASSCLIDRMNTI